MIGLKQQITGFTIGYAKEQALNIAGGVLSRFLTAYKEPYRIVVMTTEPGMPKICAIARLQEKIEMRISSEWQSFLPTITNPLIRALVQTAFDTTEGASPTLAMMTQRVWIATKPISMRVKMLFAEDVSAEDEVVTMCKNLQMLASPGKHGQVLTAPGPSPSWGRKEDTVGNIGGGSITIKVGTFLTFVNVIIDDLNVSYHTRMSVTGKPIFAEVDLMFSTYEVITKDQIGVVGKTGAAETIYGDVRKRFDNDGVGEVSPVGGATPAGGEEFEGFGGGTTRGAGATGAW